MTWYTALFVYFIVWWLVLFTVLPWGVRQPNSDEVEPGQMSGAPVKSNIWIKLAATSLIAGLLWVGVYFLITSDWITFRDNTPV